MEVISYTYARNHLAEVTDRVCESRTSVVITRQGAPSVVLLSLEDYEAMEETAYLLRSPVNAARLAEAVTQIESGQGTERDLIDPE
ncbi:MAG: type II toxin-antitoxin system prevent-host-death family antitoxin [Bryobacteraceae bacterium]|nr:type II toxin-antitoxin system prevent-host-death family antitoxin [Bryobacteraceae bacterium]